MTTNQLLIPELKKKMDIKILRQTISTLEFEWNQIEFCDLYKVERKLKKNNWKTVYW